ncbi:MAG TPA: hypothetical protein VK983_01560 [Candidatus Limnocylindrales bacterium]|nr:hypothetical protein [Candidatus Limnocylindrales bacterium]
MKKVSWNISNNPDNGKKYDRTIYQCETDDIWITTEIPQVESIQQNS